MVAGSIVAPSEITTEEGVKSVSSVSKGTVIKISPSSSSIVGTLSPCIPKVNVRILASSESIGSGVVLVVVVVVVVVGSGFRGLGLQLL